MIRPAQVRAPSAPTLSILVINEKDHRKGRDNLVTQDFGRISSTLASRADSERVPVSSIGYEVRNTIHLSHEFVQG